MRKSCFFVNFLVAPQQILRNLLFLITLGVKQYLQRIIVTLSFSFVQWCTINWVALMNLFSDQTFFEFAASFSKRFQIFLVDPFSMNSKDFDNKLYFKATILKQY